VVGVAEAEKVGAEVCVEPLLGVGVGLALGLGLAYTSLWMWLLPVEMYTAPEAGSAATPLGPLMLALRAGMLGRGRGAAAPVPNRVLTTPVECRQRRRTGQCQPGCCSALGCSATAA
jgi:hypothetical protein